MQLQLSQHNLSSQTKQSGESKLMWYVKLKILFKGRVMQGFTSVN